MAVEGVGGELVSGALSLICRVFSGNSLVFGAAIRHPKPISCIFPGSWMQIRYFEEQGIVFSDQGRVRREQGPRLVRVPGWRDSALSLAIHHPLCRGQNRLAMRLATLCQELALRASTLRGRGR